MKHAFKSCAMRRRQWVGVFGTVLLLISAHVSATQTFSKKFPFVIAEAIEDVKSQAQGISPIMQFDGKDWSVFQWDLEVNGGTCTDSSGNPIDSKKPTASIRSFARSSGDKNPKAFSTWHSTEHRKAKVSPTYAMCFAYYNDAGLESAQWGLRIKQKITGRYYFNQNTQVEQFTFGHTDPSGKHIDTSVKRVLFNQWGQDERNLIKGSKDQLPKGITPKKLPKLRLVFDKDGLGDMGKQGVLVYVTAKKVLKPTQLTDPEVFTEGCDAIHYDAFVLTSEGRKPRIFNSRAQFNCGESEGIASESKPEYLVKVGRHWMVVVTSTGYESGSTIWYRLTGGDMEYFVGF